MFAEKYKLKIFCLTNWFEPFPMNRCLRRKSIGINVDLISNLLFEIYKINLFYLVLETINKGITVFKMKSLISHE